MQEMQNEMDEQKLENTLYPTDVTGVIGEWLEMDTSEVPYEAIRCLQRAYALCVQKFELRQATTMPSDVGNSSEMHIRIYQIDVAGEDVSEKAVKLKFLSLESMQKHTGSNKVDTDLYKLVYDGTLAAETLEDVYSAFNRSDRPNADTMTSMSVSDLVEVVSGTASTPIGMYYCDAIGFAKIEF